MSEQATTPFSEKVRLLSDLWMVYRDEPVFQELFEYGDLAFPLTFAIDQAVVDSTPIAEGYIEEAWDLFLGLLEIQDTGEFDTLDEMFDLAGKDFPI